VIKHIQPNEGWIVGGQVVLILGENFFDGLQVMFNTMVVYSEVRSSPRLPERRHSILPSSRFSLRALSVFILHRDTALVLSTSRSPTKANSYAEIVLVGLLISVREAAMYFSTTTKTNYFCLLAIQDPTIDYSLQRLSKMIPKHVDDPDRLSKVRTTTEFPADERCMFSTYLGDYSQTHS
jgi:early B-cell factor